MKKFGKKSMILDGNKIKESKIIIVEELKINKNNKFRKNFIVSDKLEKILEDFAYEYAIEPLLSFAILRNKKTLKKTINKIYKYFRDTV